MVATGLNIAPISEQLRTREIDYDEFLPVTIIGRGMLFNVVPMKKQIDFLRNLGRSVMLRILKHKTKKHEQT